MLIFQLKIMDSGLLIVCFHRRSTVANSTHEDINMNVTVIIITLNTIL